MSGRRRIPTLRSCTHFVLTPASSIFVLSVLLTFGALDVVSMQSVTRKIRMRLPSVRTALAALALSLAGALPSFGADPGPRNLVLACAGPFAKDGDAATLLRLFGADNVRTQNVDGPEGSTIRATVVYPDIPRKRLEVTWWDDTGLRRPSAIRVGAETSDWTLAGLAVGAPLAAIAKANRKPFKISGFGWDYGGRVTSWQGGTIPTAIGNGCTPQIGLSLSPEAPQPNRLMGDGVVLSSSDKTLAAARPVIVEIGIGYPRD